MAHFVKTSCGEEFCILRCSDHDDLLEELYICDGCKSFINGSDDELEDLEVIVHEFGHFYYAKDHYSNDIINVKTAPDLGEDYDDCIYGKNKNDLAIMNNLTLCNGCKEQIRANLYRYNHK